MAPTILKLVATQIADPTSIPPPPGYKLGARSLFSDDLRDRNDALVGQHSGECVFVREPDMWLCHAGWKLPKGDLVAGALMDESPKFTAAIFGGTRDYRKARGQIQGSIRPNTNPQVTDYELEIHP
jgi:hypothetical protein